MTLVATTTTRRRPSSEQQCTGMNRRGERCRSWGGPSGTCGTHTLMVNMSGLSTASALTASVAAVQMDGVGWQTWRAGSRAWQSESWRLYDITGQLRFVANWAGNSVSRCRLYVAEVDESGEAANEATDPEIAALAAGPLGSGPAKDEALRLCAINLYVPGECYIIAEADGNTDGDDLWFVVSGRRIKRSGDQLIIKRPLLNGGGDMYFRPGVDLILRVWTPHPDDPDEPDSPARSAIPDLRELEAIRKRGFAELDSRLSGAGLLPLPKNMTYPRGDKDPAGIAGFTAYLGRVMSKSLQDRASAEAMVPIMFEVDTDVLDKIKPITFWSELSDQLLPMRQAAIQSLAQSLDVPPEILLGQGDVNHWSGWLISEDAVTTQIVPLLSRIADALTTGYLRGALEAMGEDPDRYVYAFDTAPLTTRPNRAADALNYHAVGLISDEAAVESGAFRPDQMPSKQERLRRLAEAAILSNPALLEDPVLRDLVGIPGAPVAISLPGPPQDQPPPANPAPPAPAPVEEPRGLPTQTPQTDDNAAVTVVAGLAVRRALALAGGRLVAHTMRDRWPDTPRYQLHTRHGEITTARAEVVLRGAWEDMPNVAADLGLDTDQLIRLLHGFTVELLTRGMAYDPALLRDTISAAMGGRRLDAALSIGCAA